MNTRHINQMADYCHRLNNETTSTTVRKNKINPLKTSLAISTPSKRTLAHMHRTGTRELFSLNVHACIVTAVFPDLPYLFPWKKNRGVSILYYPAILETQRLLSGVDSRFWGGGFGCDSPGKCWKLGVAREALFHTFWRGFTCIFTRIYSRLNQR